MSLINHHPIIFENNNFDPLVEYIDQHYSTKKIMVLVDSNTSQMCLPVVQNAAPIFDQIFITEVSAGEQSKSLEICSSIWGKLTDNNFNRNDLIINLGGGMISDLGGFVASTFKRGMDYINIPTSLLGQVDASIGGKTGVNFMQYKNLIGSITLPKAVFIYADLLRTLPMRQVYSGFAEIVKSALIIDEQFWQKIKNIEQLNIDKVSVLVKRSCEIKQTIVDNDINETGVRKTLNFGHTVGHALESYSMNNHESPCFHGEAVAMGMICETFISYRLQKLSKKNLDEVVSFLVTHFPKISFDLKDSSYLLSVMKKDKKNTTQAYNFTLLEDIGKATYDIEVPEELILDSLEYLHHLNF